MTKSTKQNYMVFCDTCSDQSDNGIYFGTLRGAKIWATKIYEGDCYLMDTREYKDEQMSSADIVANETVSVKFNSKWSDYPY